MEVGRGLVYPCQTMLDDIQIDTSSYIVVKVDMVHDNLKDLKLEVPPDNMTLTMRDAVSRRVQWRQTSIVIDPAAAASALISPALMSPEARASVSKSRATGSVSNLRAVASNYREAVEVSNLRSAASVSNSRDTTEVST
jgi:hypothetical protein